MKPDDTLRFIGMLFGAYSFITTVIITYINILKGNVLSPLEISALLSAGVAIFVSLVADLISISVRE